MLRIFDAALVAFVHQGSLPPAEVLFSNNIDPVPQAPGPHTGRNPIMKKALAIFAIVGAASLLGACSNLFGCGCAPEPSCCEPVYESPCCDVQNSAPAAQSCGASCG